jgi:predicted nuclease with RNAse H fold
VRLVGLHLLQPLGLVAGERRSALAEVDARGRLQRLDLLGGDAEILAALPPAPAIVAVDAPLAVPDEEGQRDVERVLAWCDVPVFPVSRRRLRQVFGGARGVDLAERLASGGQRVVETLPDLLMRQLAWERRQPAGAPPLDLADYRAAWLAVRAPAYRPKAAGRARPAGLSPARALLADALDLQGWSPAADPDDWTALHDAARLDALACAALALRLHRDPDALTVTLGTPERGQVVVAADANLRGRLAVNLARLRAEGAVRI